MVTQGPTAQPAQVLHPQTPHELPFFITDPQSTDVLMTAASVSLLVGLVVLGVFYFKLHALPEQMAHRGQKVQFEIVAVLALLALFTHNHLFWVAGLLLALVPLPDLTTPLATMAASLKEIAEGSTPGRAEPSSASPYAPGPAPHPSTGESAGETIEAPGRTSDAPHEG